MDSLHGDKAKHVRAAPCTGQAEHNDSEGTTRMGSQQLLWCSLQMWPARSPGRLASSVLPSSSVFACKAVKGSLEQMHDFSYPQGAPKNHGLLIA